MRIVNQEGEYWTEGKGNYTGPGGEKRNNLSFWSKFEPAPNDKRDFGLWKILLLWTGMRFVGLKVKIKTRGGE